MNSEAGLAQIGAQDAKFLFVVSSSGPKQTFQNVWTYPKSQPAGLKPLLPGSMKYPFGDFPAVNKQVECRFMPQDHLVGLARRYYTKFLGSGVVSIHLRLGDAVGKRWSTAYLTPAAILARVINEFTAGRPAAKKIFIASQPHPKVGVCAVCFAVR